jgi:hypothetical protein
VNSNDLTELLGRCVKDAEARLRSCLRLITASNAMSITS